MQKTDNYQLNLWDAEDFVLREDFNADNRKLEDALTALEEKAALSADAADALGLAGSSATVRAGLDFLSRYNLHWWKRRPEGAFDWSYLSSAHRNAYPDSGTEDGAEYEYLGVPYENFVASVRIATGSYVGNGSKEEDTVIQFPFPAKLVYVTDLESGWHAATFIAGGRSAITMWGTGGAPITNSYRLEGHTLTISARSIPYEAMNDRTKTYLWLAIG